MLDGTMESCWLEPGPGEGAAELGSGAELGVELSSGAGSVELGSGADPAKQIFQLMFNVVIRGDMVTGARLVKKNN